MRTTLGAIQADKATAKSVGKQELAEKAIVLAQFTREIIFHVMMFEAV